MRFGDERAPLEMTNTKLSKNKLVICPQCRHGRYVSKNWFLSRCGCGCQITKDNAIYEGEARTMEKPIGIVSEDHMKFRADMERKAYEWKDEQMELRKKGKVNVPKDKSQLEGIPTSWYDGVGEGNDEKRS